MHLFCGFIAVFALSFPGPGDFRTAAAAAITATDPQHVRAQSTFTALTISSRSPGRSDLSTSSFIRPSDSQQPLKGRKFGPRSPVRKGLASDPVLVLVFFALAFLIAKCADAIRLPINSKGTRSLAAGGQDNCASLAAAEAALAETKPAAGELPPEVQQQLNFLQLPESDAKTLTEQEQSSVSDALARLKRLIGNAEKSTAAAKGFRESLEEDARELEKLTAAIAPGEPLPAAALTLKRDIESDLPQLQGLEAAAEAAQQNLRDVGATAEQGAWALHELAVRLSSKGNPSASAVAALAAARTVRGEPLSLPAFPAPSVLLALLDLSNSMLHSLNEAKAAIGKASLEGHTSSDIAKLLKAADAKVRAAKHMSSQLLQLNIFSPSKHLKHSYKQLEIRMRAKEASLQQQQAQQTQSLRKHLKQKHEKEEATCTEADASAYGRKVKEAAEKLKSVLGRLDQGGSSTTPGTQQQRNLNLLEAPYHLTADALSLAERINTAFISGTDTGVTFQSAVTEATELMGTAKSMLETRWKNSLHLLQQSAVGGRSALVKARDALEDAAKIKQQQEEEERKSGEEAARPGPLPDRTSSISSSTSSCSSCSSTGSTSGSSLSGAEELLLYYMQKVTLLASETKQQREELGVLIRCYKPHPGLILLHDQLEDVFSAAAAEVGAAADLLVDQWLSQMEAAAEQEATAKAAAKEAARTRGGGQQRAAADKAMAAAITAKKAAAERAATGYRHLQRLQVDEFTISRLQRGMMRSRVMPSSSPLPALLLRPAPGTPPITSLPRQSKGSFRRKKLSKGQQQTQASISQLFLMGDSESKLHMQTPPSQQLDQEQSTLQSGDLSLSLFFPPLHVNQVSTLNLSLQRRRPSGLRRVNSWGPTGESSEKARAGDQLGTHTWAASSRATKIPTNEPGTQFYGSLETRRPFRKGVEDKTKSPEKETGKEAEKEKTEEETEKEKTEKSENKTQPMVRMRIDLNTDSDTDADVADDLFGSISSLLTLKGTPAVEDGASVLELMVLDDLGQATTKAEEETAGGAAEALLATTEAEISISNEAEESQQKEQSSVETVRKEPREECKRKRRKKPARRHNTVAIDFGISRALGGSRKHQKDPKDLHDEEEEVSGISTDQSNAGSSQKVWEEGTSSSPEDQWTNRQQWGPQEPSDRRRRRWSLLHIPFGHGSLGRERQGSKKTLPDAAQLQTQSLERKNVKTRRIGLGLFGRSTIRTLNRVEEEPTGKETREAQDAESKTESEQGDETKGGSEVKETDKSSQAGGKEKTKRTGKHREKHKVKDKQRQKEKEKLQGKTSMSTETDK
ncbi:hypothetical protein, conserved [Eimeria tenella]|uniref:Transmembrane protein n=1 Tax=Eimeria tenella TaxID=5802 RepID=U6L1I2_EIMTE|nr:hypothetical protein, conserved [Eimeria tenella]CDJ43053.1 hypothetical protein, conserved [Eimeria tenella]|eukprot:XP_013233803.1 hypothetical protein, conserved [Eimeria tenella]